MSNRQLTRMKPEEVHAILDTRAGEILRAEEAQARLDERKEFAQRVKKQLKYDKLAHAIEKETIATPVDLILLKTLDRLGIYPLDRASVMRYQHAMANKSLNMFLKGFGFPILFSGILATTIIVIAALQSASPIAAALQVHWIWAAITGVGFFMVWVEHALIPRREWRRASLDGSFFTRDAALIPREALELSLRIGEALPKAQFELHVLERNYGPKVLLIRIITYIMDGIVESLSSEDPDPFLSVHFGGELYFIAAWDEPGFDGRLMKVE